MVADGNSLSAERDAPLEHVVLFTVADVPVRVESNSDLVTVAAATRHGAPFLGATAAAAAAPCRLQVRVRRGGMPSDDGVDVRWSFPSRDRASVAASGLSATLDLAAGVAVIDADESFVRSAALFQRTVLEGMLFTLLTRRDRHPVHSGALCAGDVALLLRGSSGVGKSTLAYVAHRAGIGVLADDSVRVQLEPELRVWGDGPTPRVHLLEDARDEFAELRDHAVSRPSSGGVRKLAVALPAPAVEWSPFARAARVCLLTRAGTVSVRNATAREIFDTLMHSPEAELDLAPEQRDRVAAALASPGGWHLTLSNRASEAIPHLRDMLAQIR